MHVSLSHCDRLALRMLARGKCGDLKMYLFRLDSPTGKVAGILTIDGISNAEYAGVHMFFAYLRVRTRICGSVLRVTS